MISTFLIFAYVALCMIVLLPIGLFALLFSLLGLQKLKALIVSFCTKVWAVSLIKFTGCTVTVTGRENIPKKGGVCFVSNHDGYFDIILLFAYCGRPVGIVAKKELIFIPFLNIWIYLIGGLFIDRTSIRKASRTISKGVERIKSGGGMVIFPEGHRSKGRGLLPFHPGSLKLATQAAAPIVPVAIKGSYNIFEKTGRFNKSTMNVTFCEPINTAEIPSADRKLILSDRIFTVIKDELGKMQE